MATADPHPSATLARFASTLRFEDIPAPVLRRAEDLLLDWFGSALAGKGARPVETIDTFARRMGPSGGPSEVLISRRRTSPYFAAMVNAAASHFAEQDDVLIVPEHVVDVDLAPFAHSPRCELHHLVPASVLARPGAVPAHMPDDVFSYMVRQPLCVAAPHRGECLPSDRDIRVLVLRLSLIHI